MFGYASCHNLCLFHFFSSKLFLKEGDTVETYMINIIAYAYLFRTYTFYNTTSDYADEKQVFL
jgi:hypothetical protein